MDGALEELKLADLVCALIEGPFENPIWTGFLESLRRATGADYSILIFVPPRRPMDEGIQAFADGPNAALITELYRNCFCVRRSPRATGVDGETSSLEDALGLDAENAQNLSETLSETFGIVHSHYIRVTEPNGVEGWLVIARCNGRFSDASIDILSALARPLRGTLRAYVDAEKGKFRSRMAAEAVRRMQCGWFLLDQCCHVLAADEFGEAVLARSTVLSRSANGRLTVSPAELDREVSQLVGQIVGRPDARPRVLSLSSDPWLDMLFVPARKKMISDTAIPAVIAYVHSDNWRSADRCGQLSDLFDLSPSEAKLALTMCRGKNLSEAAKELGLAIETVRSYSKSVYSKTGTRGMADLVRVIMSSILTLSPDY